MLILAGEPGDGVDATYAVDIVQAWDESQAFKKCGDRGKAARQQKQWIGKSPQLPIYQCSG